MQLKDVLIALAAPALISAAAIPQDPEFPEGDFPEDPIVGGTTAAQGEFPYIVSIQKSGSHFCGGSLLNASSLQIRVGSNVSTTIGTWCQYDMRT
jgi:trypsin